MTVFLAIVAVLCLIAIIGTKEENERQCFTYCFITTMLGLIALIIIK